MYLIIRSVNNIHLYFSTDFQYKEIDAKNCEEYNFQDYKKLEDAEDVCSKDSMCKGVRLSYYWRTHMYYDRTEIVD